MPFFVINGKVALPGAQPSEAFRSALEQAMEAEPVGTCELDPATGGRKC